MEIQPSGGTLFPFNDPVHFLEDMENMLPFDFFHSSSTMGGCRGGMEECVIDLQYRSVCENRGPFDHIFQFSNVAGP